MSQSEPSSSHPVALLSLQRTRHCACTALITAGSQTERPPPTPRQIPFQAILSRRLTQAPATLSISFSINSSLSAFIFALNSSIQRPPTLANHFDSPSRTTRFSPRSYHILASNNTPHQPQIWMTGIPPPRSAAALVATVPRSARPLSEETLPSTLLSEAAVLSAPRRSTLLPTL